MKSTLVGLLSLLILWSAAAASKPGGNTQTSATYAVVVSQQTAADSGWQAVVDVLRANHQASLLTFSNSVGDVLPALRRQFPRHVAFVAAPDEVSRQYVMEIHRLTRRFDTDP